MGIFRCCYRSSECLADSMATVRGPRNGFYGEPIVLFTAALHLHAEGSNLPARP
jgi:hypothetical protein